jgi:hypothetical protein
MKGAFRSFALALALAASAGATAGLLARSARAAGNSVEDLSHMLLEDSSYKVRVQAALVLGKLGDRNAVPALTKALHDENNTVRAVAAQALGRLGAPEAADGLRATLKTERDAFVRTQMEKALAAIGSAAPGKAKRAKIYVTFGSFSGGTRSADPAALAVLRGALQRELGKLTTVTFALETGVDDKSFAKTGQLGFLIDGNVSRLDEGGGGGSLETNCDVKVMVARWPSRSIIMWTNAGAAVQSGSRPKDREIARRDCLEASAGQLGEDLTRFLQSQGG